MKQYLPILTLLLLVISCNKNKAKAGNDVELYLLSSFQLVPGKCQIDSALSTLQNSPLISNQDILQYTIASCEYRLTNSAMAKIKQLGGRTPFAITVDKKVIFYAFYMPPILSSTCFNSITMDGGFDQTNNIYMKLGYPGSLTGVNIDDQRNNPKLIATFASQGKLK